MVAFRKPPTEPVVGEAVEKALETMINLARRLEKVKIEHESFKKMEGGNYMTPREKNERIAAIRTSIRWLIAQSRGFARNRGNEGPLVDDLNDIKRRASSIRKSGKPVAARDFWVIETTSELERWLEENRLLLNVQPPDRDFTEEAWEQMVGEAAQNYRREKPAPAPKNAEETTLDAMQEFEDESEDEDGDGAEEDGDGDPEPTE